MNQESVQELLLAIKPTTTPFTVIFSGKTNKKVNGLYKPITSEIIIHNRNFDSDNQLIYTAIHEYAHHLLLRKGGLAMPRPHTQEFWVLFHNLLETAEAKGLYTSIFESEPEFVALTREIKERCLAGNGALFLELGKLLVRAEQLCRDHHARFEDYVERVLGLPKKTVSTTMHAQSLNLDPSFGWDGLSLLASLHDPEARTKAAEALSQGYSPLIAKRAALPISEDNDDAIDTLIAEYKKISRSISSMTERLHAIESKLQVMGIAPEDILP